MRVGVNNCNGDGHCLGLGHNLSDKVELGQCKYFRIRDDNAVCVAVVLKLANMVDVPVSDSNLDSFSIKNSKYNHDTKRVCVHVKLAISKPVRLVLLQRVWHVFDD